MKVIGMRLVAIAAVAAIVIGSLAVPAAAETGSAATLAKTELKFGGSSENDDWEFNRQADDNQYLLPDADTYFITEQNISWMDDDQLVLARNEFFARRGRKFSTKWIQEYFNRQKWYHGKIEEKQFTGNLFNAYETANVKFIQAYEAKRKARKKKAVNKVRMTGPNEAPDEYSDIYDGFNEAALAHWEVEQAGELGLKWISSDETATKSLGYTSMDLDGDEIEEFIVGPADKKTYGEGAVFAIYTLKDGTPEQVVMSDGNVEYFICEDNLIRREEYSDDGRWTIGYFKLSNGTLKCNSVLVMDENENADKPWYALSMAKKLQGFDTDTQETDADQELTGIGGNKDADQSNLSGTDSFDLEGVSESQVSSIGLELMSNVSVEDANEMRTAHTAVDLELVPFVIEEE